MLLKLKKKARVQLSIILAATTLANTNLPRFKSVPELKNFMIETLMHVELFFSS